MSARSILLIAAALLMTVGTVFIARNWLENQRPAPAPTAKGPVQTEVLVARTDLPTGTFINEQHVRWQIWPVDNLPKNYLVKGKSEQAKFFGSVLRRSVAAGQPIGRSQIVKAGDRGFLAAVLKPGHRAYTIKISASSAIAGLIFPGDRVDLILSQKINKKQQVSETILSNLRILAIDQSLNDQSNQPRIGKTATFEVTPKQAEILAVASGLGKLSLSLRSLVKNEAELERLISSGEALEESGATRGGTYTRDSEASILRSWSGSGVNVIRGGKAKKEKADK
jgi:pilus assembly protein CpaB